MKENSNIESADHYNRAVFPSQYGVGSKENSLAAQLFQLSIQYGQSQECILKGHQNYRTNEIIIYDLGKKTQTLAPAQPQRHFIKFMCEYGCACILEKQNDFDPIYIKIVMLQKWSSGAHDCGATSLELFNQGGFTSFFLPTIQEYNRDLEEQGQLFITALKQKLEFIYSREVKRNKHHAAQFSQQQFEEACKMAVDNRLRALRVIVSEERDSAYTIGRNISLKRSNAAMPWYLVRACLLNKLGASLQDSIASYKFLVGFRGGVLKRATLLKRGKYERGEVEKYKSCLDQLILQYKHRVSRNENDSVKFSGLICQIQDSITQIRGFKLTSKFENQNYPYQELNIEEVGSSFLVYPQKNNQKPQSNHIQPIGKFPIKIEDKKFMFEELLEIKDKIQAERKQIDKTQDKKDEIQSKLNRWILLVEEAIWDVSNQLCNRQAVLDLQIHMRQIECHVGESGLSTMGQLVLKYEEEIRRNPAYYGMGLVGQAESHMQLVRAITAVIAFQSVKLHREKRKSNLSLYSVPFDIEELFNKFHSISEEARKAMIQLRIYNQYRKKVKIFELNNTSTAFHDFARKAAEQWRSAKVWIETINKLHQKQGLVNNCKTQFQRGFPGYINIPSQQNIFPNLLSPIQSLRSYYLNDPYLFAFLHNTPPDVLGMMKLLYLAQNPVESVSSPQSLDESKNLLFINHLFETEKLPVQIFANKQPNYLALNPNDKGYIYFKKSIYSSNYSTIPFYQEISHFQCNNQDQAIRALLSRFLAPPTNQLTRQHEVYANLDKRPKEISISNFQAISNVRSGKNVQLMLLCSAILNRRIISNSYDAGSLFAERVILQTGASLSAYHPATEKYFGKIQQLIKQFLTVWSFTDTRFCPVLVPMLSFLGRQIVNDDLVDGDDNKREVLNMHYKFSLKCLEEYHRVEKQLKSNPEMKVKWDQRYVIMAAICCFREVRLALDDEDQIITLLQLIFLRKTCKILSAMENRPPGKRQFQRELQFHVEKAIYRNIGVISQFVAEKKNQKILNQIVLKLDKNFPKGIRWESIHPFHFRGASINSQDFYQLDIYNGCVYKNGKQISCLDKRIKSNPYYRQIFTRYTNPQNKEKGQLRQFHVFPSHHKKYFLTNDNFNLHFQIDQSLYGKISFQFSENGKEIRHLIQKGEEEEIWTLIPRQKLRQSQCHIPQLYIENYLAWFSEKRKCIVFRKPNFEHIYEIGMVVFVELTPRQPKIIKASHITYHNGYKNQNLNKICQRQKSQYQEIILRSKSKQLTEITPFRVLSEFEKPTYILELKNKANQIYYFLHRYQLKFKVANQRLLSQTYFGYALDCSHFQNRKSLFKQFPCLLLQKYGDHSSNLGNHKKMMLVSDGQIGWNGKIIKSEKPQMKFKLYKFDIHDFFGDMRGIDRQSLFHLAGVMLSINDNIKIESLEMTPLQYAMYLMNSCFDNRPFLEVQFKKLKKIFEFGKTEVILLSKALWKVATSLSKNLPFPSQRQKMNCVLQQKLQNQINFCKTLYNNNQKNESIRFRERIDNNILKILGMKKDESKKYDYSYNQKFWKNIETFTGESLISHMQTIKNNYQEFSKSTQQFNIRSKQNYQENRIKVESPKFPQQIKQANKNKNQMMTKTIAQLLKSFDSYCKQDQQLKYIESIMTEEQRVKKLNQAGALKTKAQTILKQIETTISAMKLQNDSHPDIIAGVRPTLSPAMYTSILCHEDLIMEYYPGLLPNVVILLKQNLKIWLDLKTRIGSFQRITLLLNQQKLDIIAFLREVQSPRKKIYQKNEWLCFEAQMKIQIWLSQIQTYQKLMKQKSPKEKPGLYCQLNMGQGKTQVIIPLIILHIIFSNKGKQKVLPRINLLSSLFQQARGNFFKFLSATGFKIPALQIPFNRSVKLTKNTIKAVKSLANSLSNRAYLLMTRESRLSQILRFQEGKIIRKKLNDYTKYMQTQKKGGKGKPSELPQSVKYINNCRKRDPNFQFDFNQEDCNRNLIENDIIDIFDEIDALMDCRRSYIYSIGEPTISDEDKMRYEILRHCIEVFLKKQLKSCLEKKIAITDETDKDALRMVQKGQYPIGLRLAFENLPQKTILQFRRSLARTILFETDRPQYSFVKKFKQQEKERKQVSLIQYVVNPDIPDTLQIPDGSKDQIYLLRGALAYGILEHCLSMRCGVDFGVPGKHIKRTAVPYEAADIPSKTSQYQQLDVAILLSYAAYFNRGLSEIFFDDCLKSLLEGLSQSSRDSQYKQWISILDKEGKDKIQKLELQSVNKINFNSKIHRKQLFNIFRKNRKTVAFWLVQCVFENDLRHYSHSICSSPWDLANVRLSIGFSGTRVQLLSDKLSPCQSKEIDATDGKMIYRINNYTNEVALIQQSQSLIKQPMLQGQKEIEGQTNSQNVNRPPLALWQRFIDKAIEKGAGCIIDAGALCVGKSLRKEIVPWIAENKKFKQMNQKLRQKKYIGISFCDIDGQWFVYDIQENIYIKRGTTIPDHQTFVIFDQARTRGADLKMDENVVAALSLGRNLKKNDFMQAAGRLRKLGRNQRLVIMGTQEVFSHISKQQKDDKQCLQYIKDMNDISESKLPNLIMAWCLQNSVQQNLDLLMQYANLGWKHLYSIKYKEPKLQNLTTDLKEMYSKPSPATRVSLIGDNNLAQEFKGEQSGKYIIQLLQKYGKSVEKQVGSLDNVCQRQIEIELEKQQEKQYNPSTTIAIPQAQASVITDNHPFYLDHKFKMTDNFKDTTKSPDNPQRYQIPQLNFVKVTQNYVIAVSNRQASILIEETIIKKANNQKMSYGIYMLSSLSIDSEIIVKNGLQYALINAKFVSGVANYTKKEEDYLVSMILSSPMFKEKKFKDESELSSQFLRKKYMYLNKFKGSTLEKIVVRLKNQA